MLKKHELFHKNDGGGDSHSKKVNQNRGRTGQGGNWTVTDGLSILELHS